MSKLAKIVSTWGSKGDLGKSALTFHLAITIAENNLRVLLVDIDPQCQLTLFGMSEHELEAIWDKEEELTTDFQTAKNTLSIESFNKIHQQSHSIDYILQSDIYCCDEEKTLPTPIHVAKGLDLIPGRMTLSLLEYKLTKSWGDALLGDHQAIRAITAVRRKCQQYAKAYDYDLVIINTSANPGMLNKVAICGSDGLALLCAPDMRSHYGARVIGKALSTWRREHTIMQSLLPSPKAKDFPHKFVKLLGYAIYSDTHCHHILSELETTCDHGNDRHTKELPETIKRYFPKPCLVDDDYLPMLDLSITYSENRGTGRGSREDEYLSMVKGLLDRLI